MTNSAYLMIGDKTILQFRWYIPPDMEDLLGFIFQPEDKVLTKIPESGADEYYFMSYETSARTVRERLDKFHLSLKEIDELISEVAKVPVRKIGLALMEHEEYSEKYHIRDEKDLTKAETENRRRIEEKKEEYESRIEESELGNYPDLRRIRKFLNRAKSETKVTLELGDLSYGQGRKEDLEEIELIKLSYTEEERIEKKYLRSAEIHFTERKYDLTYVEMIIALESAVKSYLEKFAKKHGRVRLNLRGILKDLSLIDAFKFIVIFIKRAELDSDFLEGLETVYNKRNNIIHNNGRRYTAVEVNESLEFVRKAIKLID